MSQIVKGKSFADGDTVHGSDLNTAFDSATIDPTFISGQTNVASPTLGSDYLLFWQASSSTLKKTLMSSVNPGSSGVSESVSQSAHGFAVKDVVYCSASGTYAKAKADVLSTATAVGIVSVVTDVNTFTITYSGRITGLSGLTAATVYYVSESSAGALQTSPPMIHSKPVLFATTTGAGVVLSGGVSKGPDTDICDGRLTLTSGTAVPTVDVTAATSVFFTPFNGDQVTLFNGTYWIPYTFTELTLSLGSSAANSVFDIFIYDNSGTLTLELSAAWASDTSRTTAIDLQNGVWCKHGALTRRWLGTVRTTATTGQTECSFGGTGAGGSAAKWYLWNNLNRRNIPMVVKDNTDSWTYSTATIRPLDNSTNNRVSYVVGLNEITVRSLCSYINYNSATVRSSVGIGVDSTTTYSGYVSPAQLANASALAATYNGYVGRPGLGFHYIQALELGGGSGTTTFEGDSGVATQQGALVVEIEA